MIIDTSTMAACKKTLAVVLHGKDDLRLVEKELIEPHPNKGEVLLAIQSVGICGSDVHFWVDGHIGDFAITAPTVMGHESSGLIVAVGEGVTHLKPGDRVAIEPGVPCYQCSYCKSGRYNLCPDVKFGSTPPVNGCLTHFFIHPADFCFKLPDHVSFDEGALIEPISVGVYACQRAQIRVGSRVLVCGSGPIGLVCMMVAKAYGASEVIIIDLDLGRLEVAKKCGADHVLQVKTTDSKQLAQDITDLLGYKPDQTIECTGAKTAIATGIYATRFGGVLVLVGLGASEVALPIIDASIREVDIRGVFRYCNCYPAALDLVASRRINVKPLTTHKYKLEEAITAFQTAKTGKDGAIKLCLFCLTCSIGASAWMMGIAISALCMIVILMKKKRQDILAILTL